MAYIHPQDESLTVKGYAAIRGVTTRTVYEWLTKKPDRIRATKVEGGWRIPFPVYVPESPYIGQLVTFGDGTTCEIVDISDNGITARRLVSS